MKRTFYEMKHFTKKWNELGFTDDDLRSLQNMLLENPKAGPVMQGTGGLRKVRFAFPNSGKSGSVRVCYIDIEGVLEIHNQAQETRDFSHESPALDYESFLVQLFSMPHRTQARSTKREPLLN